MIQKEPAMINRFVFSLLFFFILGGASAQSTRPWTQDQLQDPEALANILRNKSAKQPLIFNIGPMENIKGATSIGPTKDKSNLDKLRKALATVPKDKTVIIYCGCCPFRVCPNISPAFELLKEMKFTNPRLLNLEHNLKSNWIDQGYPMQ
ncbi:MAG: rhodanese-like domain-containing protein [Bacteroidetes bacterium]|nr:rhodanese-like domain-containing protein [Bacteroidota bacterium]